MKNELINIETIRKISLESKTRMLHDLMKNDIEATKKYFDLSKGIEQVLGHPSGYIPGLAGHILLTEGVNKLTDLSLGEEDINKILLLILKSQSQVKEIFKSSPFNNAEKECSIAFPALDAAKVIRESFQIVN